MSSIMNEYLGTELDMLLCFELSIVSTQLGLALKAQDYSIEFN